LNEGSISALATKIYNFQNQIDSLQERRVQVEHSKNARSEIIDDIYASEPSQHRVAARNDVLTSVSEVFKRLLKVAKRSEDNNIPSIDNTTQNGSNFITLENIAEQEKIKIIQTRFQRQAKKRISLKNYYESTEE